MGVRCREVGVRLGRPQVEEHVAPLVHQSHLATSAWPHVTCLPSLSWPLTDTFNTKSKQHMDPMNVFFMGLEQALAAAAASPKYSHPSGLSPVALYFLGKAAFEQWILEEVENGYLTAPRATAPAAAAASDAAGIPVASGGETPAAAADVSAAVAALSLAAAGAE